MYESDINLEHEAFELMEGLNDLMRVAMASEFNLETVSRMSGQDLETIKLMNRVYKQSKDYAIHQAAKIDEIDHKICKLYALIKEKE